jgi:hypothetical protein
MASSLGLAPLTAAEAYDPLAAVGVGTSPIVNPSPSPTTAVVVASAPAPVPAPAPSSTGASAAAPAAAAAPSTTGSNKRPRVESEKASAAVAEEELKKRPKEGGEGEVRGPSPQQAGEVAGSESAAADLVEQLEALQKEMRRKEAASKAMQEQLLTQLAEARAKTEAMRGEYDIVQGAVRQALGMVDTTRAAYAASEEQRKALALAAAEVQQLVGARTPDAVLPALQALKQEREQAQAEAVRARALMAQEKEKAEKMWNTVTAGVKDKANMEERIRAQARALEVAAADKAQAVLVRGVSRRGVLPVGCCLCVVVSRALCFTPKNPHPRFMSTHTHTYIHTRAPRVPAPPPTGRGEEAAGNGAGDGAGGQGGGGGGAGPVAGTRADAGGEGGVGPGSGQAQGRPRQRAHLGGEGGGCVRVRVCWGEGWVGGLEGGGWGRRRRPPSWPESPTVSFLPSLSVYVCVCR